MKESASARRRVANPCAQKKAPHRLHTVCLYPESSLQDDRHAGDVKIVRNVGSSTDGGMFARDRIAQQFPLLLLECDFEPGDTKFRLPHMSSGLSAFRLLSEEATGGHFWQDLSA